MKILHVISNAAEPALRELVALSRELPRNSFEMRVCVLGRDSSTPLRLREAGAAVDVLAGWRLVPLGAWWRLHHLVRSYRPDVIHAWDRGSLGMVHLTGGQAMARVLARFSEADKPFSVASAVQRWLSPKCDHMIVTSEAERRQCLALEAARDVTLLRPVATPAERSGQVHDLPEVVLTPGARWIVCAGSLAYHDGVKTALWAFDLLCFLYDKLHLLLVGDSPDRGMVEEHAAMLRGRRQVHVLGSRSDQWHLVRRAEIVWTLSADDVNTALDGMAAGRPVVALGHTSLSEVIGSGENGILVPPGEPAALAAKTRELLEDQALAARLGAAAQDDARLRFSLADLVNGYARLYRELAA